MSLVSPATTMQDHGSLAAAGAVLVIDDEPGIIDVLARGLAAYGFTVTAALNGIEGTERAIAEPIDLVVLDLILPGRSGMEVLAAIQERKPGLPVIALTARSELNDRVAGLDAGFVDYLTKPFSVRELAARIRAQLRAAAQAPPTRLVGGDIELDLLSRQVRRAGELVRLSGTEFELLSYLIRNANRVLSREQILQAVWGYDHDPGTNVVDVYVGYLRRKLRRPDAPVPILTVRTVGYRFELPSAGP